ncbi:MAG: prolyl oligopeptidase family serine peptidase [Terracidiphilus sp.]
MLRFRTLVLPLVCFVSAGIWLHAAAQSGPTPAPSATTLHFPTNEDLRHLKALSSPILSPDGKQVLFTLTHATADGAASHLWIVPASATSADKPRQLTFSPPADKRGEHNAQWAPDNSAIFFLAKRGDHTQLFRLDLRGGEASPYDFKILPPVDVSKDKDAINPPPAPESSEKKDDKKPSNAKQEPQTIDVAGFSISFDGKYLALWAHDPETPGEKKQKEAKIDASWVNHEKHLTRIYLAAFKPDGTIEGSLNEVNLPPDVRGATWSPVADKLLVIIEPPNDASDLGPAGAAWIVDAAAPAKPTRLAYVPTSVGGGVWNADGTSIVFAASTSQDAPPGYDDLYLLAATPDAKPINLTRGFNGQLRAQGIYFTPDGSFIAPAAVGTRNTVVRIALDAKAQPTPIDLGAAVISGLNTNRKQTGWVWLADSGGHPMQLCYASKLGDPCTPLPTPTLGPANLRTVAPQLVHWKSGPFTIEGLLYLPPDTGSAKVPLVVDVHGGPFGAWEDRNDPFVDFLIGHGWAVLRPNPRGSSNYGVKFAAANKNDLGGGDYQDVMAGVDYVLANYPIDPTKLALMGYSYGGEMAGFVEGKTDRFKAIISGAPVIDQFSEYGTEGGSWYDRWYFGKPWEHMNDAWRQSPLANVAHAKTPFLILQGESDTTDPLGQAQEMYRALRQEGVPVELVTYPRENHGPLAIGMLGHPSPEPWHGYDARQRIVTFITAAFSATPPPSTAPAKQ